MVQVARMSPQNAARRVFDSVSVACMWSSIFFNGVVIYFFFYKT